MKIGDRVTITFDSRTLSGQIVEAFGEVSLSVQLDEPFLLPNAVVPAKSLPLIWEGDGYHIIGAGWWSVTVERSSDQLTGQRPTDNQRGGQMNAPIARADGIGEHLAVRNADGKLLGQGTVVAVYPQYMLVDVDGG